MDIGLLFAQLAIILGLSRAAAWLVGIMGQPRVVGEMAAGIALGPSVLGVMAPSVLHAVFPPDKMLPLATLSQVGVVLFMFAVGLRFDTAILRPRLSAAVLISHASIVLPFLLGVLLALALHPSLAPQGVPLLPFALFLGAGMSVTAFPVLARILSDAGLARTPVGSIALTCAAVDDVTAWCVLAGVIAVSRAGPVLLPLLVTAGGVILFSVLALTLGRRLLGRLYGRLESARAATSDIIAVAAVLALTSAGATEWLGVHALFGAFLAGTIFPRAHQMAERVADRMDVLAVILLPIFFALTGLRTDFGLFDRVELWGACTAIIALAILGKFGGSTVVARMTGCSWREALSIGALMNTRGLMELIILNIGLEVGVISPPLFAMMVLMAITTTVMTAPLLAVLSRCGGARSAAGEVLTATVRASGIRS